MTYEKQYFLSKAYDAQLNADLATTPDMKAGWAEIARHWIQLANHVNNDGLIIDVLLPKAGAQTPQKH